MKFSVVCGLWCVVCVCDITLLSTDPCALLLPPSGLLIAYCHRFDILIQSPRIYFGACTIGMYTDSRFHSWNVAAASW